MGVTRKRQDELGAERSVGINKYKQGIKKKQKKKTSEVLQHCEVVDPISSSEESAPEEKRRRGRTEEELLGARSSPQIV